MGVHPDAQMAAQELYKKESNRFSQYVEQAAEKGAEEMHNESELIGPGAVNNKE